MRRLCLLALLLVPVACSSTPTASPTSSPTSSPSASASPAATVQLTSADNKRTVQLAVGQKAVLSLETNPSTGYSWSVKTTPDAAIVAITDHRVTAPPQRTPPVVGAASTERWTFTAKSAGTTSFSARYVGPTGANGGTFTVTFVVS